MRKAFYSSIIFTVFVGVLFSSSVFKRWDNLKCGNHRAVVYVDKEADAVLAEIEWRRRDKEPEKKAIFIVDATSGKLIKEIFRVKITQLEGKIVFKPESIPSKYYIYYMPYTYKGSKNYPKTVYIKYKKPVNSNWYEKYSSLSADNIETLPKAKFLGIQSLNDFNEFTQMEKVASSEELSTLLKNKEKPFLLFPENRENTIRMFHRIPYRWAKKGPSKKIYLKAKIGEYLTFQIGVFSFKKDLKNIRVKFSPFYGKNGKISENSLTCFNTQGIDLKGKMFFKKVSVKKGEILPLWIGVDLKETVKAGKYRGFISIEPENEKGQEVEVILNVEREKIANRGDDNPYDLTRLRWLNSTLGEDNMPVKPFTAVKREGNRIKILGREIKIGAKGLPSSIKSFFSDTLTKITKKGNDLLVSPVTFSIVSKEKKKLVYSPLKWTREKAGLIEWELSAKNESYKLNITGKAEYDGYMEYKIRIIGLKETYLKDVFLEVPFKKDKARFMMGLGFKGGKIPEKFSWKWSREKNQDSVWIGDVNAGIQIAVRGENYIRPLNTNFYHLKPLNMPVSWYNEGKGGFSLISVNRKTIAKFFSGKRILKKGETLHFYFSFLITPFKTINTKQHWKNRYFHSFMPPEEIKKSGANIINVHHATEINPFINYPFLRPKKMKAYIDKAHKMGMKVKIYYTVRELSNHSPEIFALKSLKDEIFAPGKGGGPSWLVEHFGENYIAGWFVPKYEDAAIINNGTSRWHNYYIEGLNWLVKNVGIDGLYIDDIAFDRSVMKRIKRVFEMNGKEAIIDVHSANQYNPRDGYASSANLYLEHFPFIDRLWFGEYFDYDSQPDYWLIEISGIPFGLMGEMLQGGGNPYRGMIYGMTARLPWSGNPEYIWRVWDDFGIEDSEMIGYWSKSCPVKTDNKKILATVFRKKDKAMIAIASWDKKAVRAKLIIDREKLGLKGNNFILYAPEIKDFQKERIFNLNERIPILPKKGWILILKKK